MKNVKKILIATLFLAGVPAKSDNLPGKTRNLNIIQLHPHMYVQLSAGENDSQNILRDLACNCDNPNFEMTIALKLKLFEMTTGAKGFKKLLDNPAIRTVALEIYLDDITEEAKRNIKAFFYRDLKELLLSQGADGKSALDIVNGKPEELGCILLKEAFNGIKEEINAYEEKQRKQE